MTPLWTQRSSAWGRPVVMGILNVTPDSFSDGGRWADSQAAVAAGLKMVRDGADLVDVGGESTRPGAARPPLEEELRRVIPVVEGLARAGVAVSVDTMRAEVAQAAIAAGAEVINDVSGGLADPAMASVVAASPVTYVAMHWRAHSEQMVDFADYEPEGVVRTVAAELGARTTALLEAGLAPDRLVLDPGLGFAKRAEHNWEVLAGLDHLSQLGFPLLFGASRKSFLGALLADEAGVARPTDQREHAHAALVGWLTARKVWGLRVHDVRSTRDAIAVARRLEGTT